jgi:hexulose-6-phosphate isomerase
MPAHRRNFLTAALAAGVPATAGARAADGVPSGPVPWPPRPDHGLLFSCKYGMTQGPTLEARLLSAHEAGMDGVDFDDAASVTPERLREAVQSTGVFVHNAINHAHWRQTLTNADATVRATGRNNLEHCIRVSHAAGGDAVLLVIGKAADGPQAIDRAREGIRQAIPLAAALGQRILVENVWNGLFYVEDGPADQTAKAFADFIDGFASPWVGAFFDLGNHARYGDVAGWIRELGPRIVKLDIKGYSRARGISEGKAKGFVDITAGDIDWKEVRRALRDVGFTGWVSAEVEGGDVNRLKSVLDQMKQALLG